MGQLKHSKILLLEDNVEFAQNFVQTLKIYFGDVVHALKGQEAFELYKEGTIDIIISDIKLADENGLDFVERIRKEDKEIPIIILSAHKDEQFLFSAIGLNILAYELKPLNFSRLQYLIQLIKKRLQLENRVLIKEHLFYLYSEQSLLYKEEKISLTKKEALFIELLLAKKQGIVSQEEIQKELWQDKVMSESALKNFLLRLRKKCAQDFIKTVHGVGYRFLN